MSGKKTINEVINHPYTWTITAQTYANGLLNYGLKGLEIATASYATVFLLGGLYIGEKSRAPFMHALKWFDSLLLGPTQPSERLKRVFNEVVQKLEPEENTYHVFSYGKSCMKPNLGRIFNRNDDLYIGPDIEAALNDEELGFAIAHSIGHAKNDDFTFPTLSNAAFFLSLSNVSYGVTRTLENMMLNNTPPLIEAFSICATPLVCVGQYYTRNRLFSKINLAADQEALKLCPDKEVAISALTKLKELTKPRKIHHKVKECLHVHPENYSNRIRAFMHS